MSQVLVTDSIKQAMQGVLDGLRAHAWYVAGDVPAARLDALVEKFRARYPVLERDRFHAHRQRRDGGVSYRLVVFRPSTTEDIEGWFVLLASRPDDSGEEWASVTDRHRRLTVYGYEAVRHTVAGQAAPRWTWRISAERMERHRAQIAEAVKKGWDDWLTKFCKSTRHWPGFAGVREQHRELGLHLTVTWARVKRSSAVMPTWPRLAYVTRRRYGATKAMVEE